MLRERIVWVVALVLVAAAGLYTGRVLGVQAGMQSRAQASQGFFSQRGGGQGTGGQGTGGQGTGGQGTGGQGTGGQGTGGQGTGGTMRGGLAGTVDAISGDTITVKTRSGQTTTVKLTADGKVHKQVDGQLSDIKAGDQVVVTGTADGDTFQATSIQIGALGGATQRQAP